MVGKKATLLLGLILVISSVVECSKDWTEDMFPYKWTEYSKKRIDSMLSRELNGNVAKNVILYLGDGMGITTVTAGRILKGQFKGDNGEEMVTAMESLEHSALVKTYNIDAQTPDSAGTATAFHTGVKTRLGAIGVNGRAVDCKSSLDNKLESVLKWAHYAGKSTGIITTARVTHATPAAAFANAPTRNWEAFDGIHFNDTQHAEGCKDIAAQLIEENSFIDLVFGGGRRKFLRNTDSDHKDPLKKGDRIDNRNLIDEWTDKMRRQNLQHKFLWNKTDFLNLRPYEYDHILGLFNWDHMDYDIDREENKEEPSIKEMVKKAIEILSTNPKGFYLLVEAGRIDHGHHNSNAQLALTDFVAFDEAISQGLEITDESETLSVVTADHSHVFTIGAYSTRGHNLFDTNTNHNGNLSDEDLTYTALLYGNGPGKLPNRRTYNLTNEQTNSKSYLQESAVYMKSETHGGEDVSIYARGPMSYLFDGTIEQSHIAHVMAYSACIGPYNSTNYANCKFKRGVLVTQSGSSRISFRGSHIFFIVFIFSIYFKLY